MKLLFPRLSLLPLLSVAALAQPATPAAPPPDAPSAPANDPAPARKAAVRIGEWQQLPPSQPPILPVASAPETSSDAEPAPELETGSLNGRIDGRVYFAPTGTYRITIPVLPELGGTVSDTGNVVTFEDQFNVHISIATFPQDATQRWELSTRGIKDYLIYFLNEFVIADFQRMIPGVTIDSIDFLPKRFDGALLAYTLLPGGSMFGDHRAFGSDGHPPVAKRGNLLFVKEGYIYVISTELAERVIEGTAFKKTPEEENQILKDRLFEIVGRMTFMKPAAAP